MRLPARRNRRQLRFFGSSSALHGACSRRRPFSSIVPPQRMIIGPPLVGLRL